MTHIEADAAIATRPSAAPAEVSVVFPTNSDTSRYFSVHAGEHPVRSIPATVANRSLGVLLPDAVLGAD